MLVLLNRPTRSLFVLTVAMLPLPAALARAGAVAPLTGSQMTAAPAVKGATAPGLLSSAELERLLPPSVFFSGQSAPLQLRNSAGYRTPDGHLIWAGLVDTSGYSTGVREKYQFYLVAEVATSFGGRNLPAGAYGAGFLENNRFVVLDVGGGTYSEGATESDQGLRRPRPLQMVEEHGELRLYVGRQYVSIRPVTQGQLKPADGAAAGRIR